MSYIHKALRKAQREKDSRYQQYDGVLSGRKKKMNPFPGSALWWVFLIVIVTLLAFASYSWFDSDKKPLPEARKNEREKPVPVPAKKDIAAAPAKKRKTKSTRVTDAKGLYDKARAFHKSGRLRNAKRLYQDTLKVDPGYVDALNNLGVIFIHEKDYEAARRNFEKAGRIRPEHVDPHYNLACVYALKQENKEAMVHLKRACSLDRDAKKWARVDTDLKNLRGMPEFEEIIKD